jgi:hypothetical protein
MPVLASFPVVENQRDVVSPFLDSRRLSFRSLNGTDALAFTGGEFIALWGAQGLEVPPRDVVEGAVVGVDGSFIDDVKIGSRKVMLPIYLGSKSGHLPYLGRRGYLRSFFNHRGVDLAATDGTFDLVATSAIGERTLRCLYKSGMDGDWVQDSSGSYWERIGLDLLAVRSYWYGKRWETPPINAPESSEFFDEFPPELSSSRAFGTDVPVFVDGDVESWVRVDGVGPCDSLLVEAEGLHLSIPGGLEVGEVVSLDTDPRSRRRGGAVLFNGTEDMSRVAPDDVWAPLQPGLQLMNLVLPGADAATRITVSGDTRYETPW